MSILITHGRIIDVKNGIDIIGDLYVEDGCILEIGGHVVPYSAPTEIIDAVGLIVIPGMVDMHTHLREPGYEYKETIESATAAAAMGGFTTVAAMPNTNPVTDCKEVIEYIKDRAKMGYAHVLPIAAVTSGQRGSEINDLEALHEAGAAAFSDDGRPVLSASHMADAMVRAHKMGIPVISHCEELSLAKGGVMNEGENSRKIGVCGIPTLAEDLMIGREIILADELDVPVHIAHVSTANGVEMIKNAKIRGVKVTCETCPHYFSLTDDEVLSLGAMAKVNPPLRTQEDVEAIINGLADGTIDVIATDHAPHHKDEKALGLEKAPSGLVGLETALAVALTYLNRLGGMPLKDIIYKLTAAPADIMGIDAGTLHLGGCADITIFDADEMWTVDAEKFESKGKNTPYNDMKLYGRVKYTICGGKIVVRNGILCRH